MRLSSFLGLVLLALVLMGGFVGWQIVRVGGIKSVKEIFTSSKVAGQVNQASDKYTDKTVPQQNNGFYRGRYVEFVGNKIKLEINDSRMEFVTDSNTTYSCQPRIIKQSDGSMKDALELNLDFSKYKGGRMGEVPNGDKFRSVVTVGDVVIVYVGEKFGSSANIVASVAIISDDCKL